MSTIKFQLKWDTIKGGDGYPIYAQMDLVAFACDEHDKCVDFVFFKNPRNEYITYTEFGKDQILEIDFGKIPDKVQYILCVAIMNQSAGYADFSVIKKCHFRIEDENGAFMTSGKVQKRLFNNNNESLILAKICRTAKEWGITRYIKSCNKATLKDWIKILEAEDTEAFNNILDSDNELSLKSITSKMLFPIQNDD